VLPSGADQVDAFLALDEAFHRALIKMVKAAKKNDVAATAEQFGVLMNRCEGCHARYRGQREAAD
jgi:cytochrome c556